VELLREQAYGSTVAAVSGVFYGRRLSVVCFSPFCCFGNVQRKATARGTPLDIKAHLDMGRPTKSVAPKNGATCYQPHVFSAQELLPTATSSVLPRPLPSLSNSPETPWGLPERANQKNRPYFSIVTRKQPQTGSQKLVYAAPVRVNLPPITSRPHSGVFEVERLCFFDPKVLPRHGFLTQKGATAWFFGVQNVLRFWLDDPS